MLSPIPLSCIATDAPHLGMHFFGFKISFWSFTSTPHWIMFNAFDTALRRNACSSVIFLARYSRLSFASDETFAYWSTKFNYNPMQIPKQQTYTRVSISVKNQILNTTMKMVTYIWTNPVVTWSVLFYIHHKLCQLYSIFTFLSKRIDFFTISGVKYFCFVGAMWCKSHLCWWGEWTETILGARGCLKTQDVNGWKLEMFEQSVLVSFFSLVTVSSTSEHRQRLTKQSLIIRV